MTAYIIAKHTANNQVKALFTFLNERLALDFMATLTRDDSSDNVSYTIKPVQVDDSLK